MPPAMKLTSDMVNAMGGRDKQFVVYCSMAFRILRINANLISNLFALMLDSRIPDIATDRDRTVQKVIDRFHLQLSDEEACQLVHRLILTSILRKCQ
uniref:PI3K/PI4K catalytic domain-containing protein n=1 Tax=Ditylenchus dipsaci TaxID=166011 RepID=A0A915CY07_9BILA